MTPVRGPRRDRSHPLQERPRLRPAPNPLPRPAENAYIGHVLTALVCNVTRIADWIAEPNRPRRGGFAGDGSPLGPLGEVLLGKGFLWGSELGDDAS